MGGSQKARWFVVALFGELALASMTWCLAAPVLYLTSCGFRTPQNSKESALLAVAVMMPMFGGYFAFKLTAYFLAVIDVRRPAEFQFPELLPSRRIAALVQGLMFLVFASVFIVLLQLEPKFHKFSELFIAVSAGFGIAGISQVCWAISEMLTAKRNRNDEDAN